MTPTEKVLRAASRSSHELDRFLRDLIRARSVTGSEEQAQGVVKDQLKSMGARVDLWCPTRKDYAGHERFVEGEERLGSRPNVVGTFKGSEGGRALAFNGHIDVVPEGDPRSWTHPPYSGEVRGGMMYGRGACDMKAGLAATIFGVKAMLDAGISLRGDLLVESVIGEESTGMGTLATILRGYRPEAAIIAEPTSLKLVTVQAGCLNFRITVKGRAAHGASREMGVSAIEKFIPIHESLLALEAKRKLAKSVDVFKDVSNPIPLSIGKVRAGDWDSTVPDELVAEGRYGVWPGESLKHASDQFERAVSTVVTKDGWLRENPPSVDWYGPQWEPAQIEADHWLVRLMSRASRDALGKIPKRAGITAGTDMRLFTGVARCPAVIFGPGDDSIAHFRDEHVDLREVADAAKVYAAAALRWDKRGP